MVARMMIKIIANMMFHCLSVFGFGWAFLVMYGIRRVPMMAAGNPPAAIKIVPIPVQPRMIKMLANIVAMMTKNVMSGAR